MSTDLHEMIQEIGRAAREQVNDLDGKLLLYAEAEDGVVSADLFYLTREGTLRHRLGGDDIAELIYGFWERWKAQPGNHPWRTMSFVIDGARFSMDMRYPDQVDPREGLPERRPAAVKQHFGDKPVDYSR